MTIERIVELEKFIEREMKGNEAFPNNAGCVARAKIDRDILACLKELKAHREAMLDDVQVKECYTCYHCGDMFRGHGDGCYDPCEGCKENGYKNYKKE